MEKESEKKIAFLDVLVEKERTSATTSIFRKETHTDRYMNYNSHHHARIKSGIIKCLKTRAETVCDTTRLSGELNHLKQVFWANGYPTRTINRNLKNHPNSRTSHPHRQEQIIETEEQEQTTQTEDQERTTPKFLHLPYVKGVSERIERKCRTWVSEQPSNQKEPSEKPWYEQRSPNRSGRRKESYTKYHVVIVTVPTSEKPAEL